MVLVTFQTNSLASPYQEKRHISKSLCNGQLSFAGGDAIESVPLFPRRVGFPVRNFSERAEAADAKTRELVNTAFPDARRLDRGLFHHAAALVAMAFAARELVGRPSWPQM